VTTRLLLEAAIRSLIMGATIFAVLRIMRIHQVRAQRTAWLLALAAALAMPALVAAQIGPRLLPDIAVFRAPWAAAMTGAGYPAEAARPGDRSISRLAAAAPAGEGGSTNSATHGVAPVSAALQCALAGYCIVAAVLLLRHAVGIVVALRLRNQSERITLPFDPAADIRISARVATPLTIASTVLLPDNYSAWDVSTLRIVLSHEGAHVRQKDFYVQMLAGIHCAIFWFNPFSWWLQRQLSELAEALSDHAAVAQSQSRVSYAEILLAFATRASSPSAAVPMARTSNLTPRIERLLNEAGFEQSFAEKRRLPFIAAGVAIVTLAASTSVVRVHAESPQSAPVVDRDTGANIEIDSDSADKQQEKILAIQSGGSRTTFDEGRLLAPIAGDYIYFRHQGKPYVIQDSSILARARELLAPMREYGRIERELGRESAGVVRRQQSLARLQSSAKIGTPDFQRDITDLTEVLEQMKRVQSAAQLDPQALAELEGKLGAIQGNLGSLQAEFGMRQGGYGAQQGALGEQQGRLVEQQSRLIEQRRRLIDEAKAQLTPLVEDAIRDGKAKPIQ
jgi:beta-lactamase regulating signal transducer with metallopeptidase domain